MITLKTSLLSENLGFNSEDIKVKSISAAWDKIREIRDTTEPQLLNTTILTIELPEGETSKRIPSKLLFKLNTKGKIEFKDYAKVECRAGKKEDMKGSSKAQTKGKNSKSDLDLISFLIQHSEELNK